MMQTTSQPRDKNYYEILEIPTNASPNEVYEGYLRAKNAYSGDSLALYSLISKDECQVLLDLIEEAYTIISDPTKRHAYDRARGIKSVVDTNAVVSSGRRPSKDAFATPAYDGDLEPDEESKRQATNLTKIVAANKYSLNYEKDAEFEKLIEQTSEFTGEFLKRIREYKSVPLDRMSEMTKVSKSYLAAIEDENWQNLPAQVYIRGFVFQYAKCLKLNPDMVANNYLNRLSKLRGKG
jgi:curved DNA-binding protein CbpA